MVQALGEMEMMEMMERMEGKRKKQEGLMQHPAWLPHFLLPRLNIGTSNYTVQSLAVYIIFLQVMQSLCNMLRTRFLSLWMRYFGPSLCIVREQ